MVLLHGGGLSFWSLQPLVDRLVNDYHLIVPIIDGHGEAFSEDFISIEDSAGKLVDYIDKFCDGHVLALCGLSLGAQIVTEVLSRRPNIAGYAVIESALVYPIKLATALTVPTYRLFYGLVKRRWFSVLQAKTLGIPESMFDLYFEDSKLMSKQSLINMALSNGNYPLKEGISQTKAKTLVVVGEKEIPIMLKSAVKLNETIPDSELLIAQGMKHGQFSLAYANRYVEKLRELIKR